MKEKFFIKSDDGKEEISSTILAFQSLKKNSNLCNVVLGVSAMLFSPNVESVYSIDNDNMYLEKRLCIPGSISFYNESTICYENLKVRKKAVAKRKHRISDEELERSLDNLNVNLGQYSDIEDFIKNNSGRFINNLEKWM